MEIDPINPLAKIMWHIESAKQGAERALKEKGAALKAEAESKHTPPAQLPTQFPLWPNVVRALPNPFARSALFNISNKKERRFHKEQILASVKGTVITYTGEELRQRDEDVFLQLLHISRNSLLGEWVDFTAYSLLKALGWTMNKRSYSELREVLDRLSATNLIVSFNDGKDGYSGSLVRKFLWRTPEGEKLPKWRVYFEPEIIALFAPTNYTHIYWELRLSLPPLAKWLHGFYSTHEHPYDYKVATLWELCGSTSGLAHFRDGLANALDILKERNFLTESAISKDSDLVRVKRTDDRRILENP